MTSLPTHDRPRRRVLFIQATEPGALPPLIHASSIMAEAGWEVAFLSAPIAGKILTLPAHPRVYVRTIRVRPSYIVRKSDYARYVAATADLALRFRPDLVYASDPLGTLPGLLAAGLARAELVYHEHDSPSAESLPPWLARIRKMAARRARFVIIPNRQRGRDLCNETTLPLSKLRVVWNMPRRGELQSVRPRGTEPLILLYHGSITPERLPETVVEAILQFSGRVCLKIIGYEAPGASGYVKRLLELGNKPERRGLTQYLGQIPRADLLRVVSDAHVGLAFMPLHSRDPNMRHMVGASNKVFEYMAAGLGVLVSDIAEWREAFVPQFARACNPENVESIVSAIAWFLDSPVEWNSMAARSQAQISTEWNYDRAFAPIMTELSYA